MTEKASPGANGVVAMLDALGTRSTDAKGAREFIRNRDQLIKDTQIDLEAIAQRGELLAKELVPNMPYAPPINLTFADNLVFCWGSSITQDNDLETNLLSIGYILLTCEYLGILMRVALRKRLLWRGAMGVGEYIHSKKRNTLLGSAVNDAASWYEKADWIGIIATPSCGMRISALKNAIEAQNATKPQNSQLLPRFPEICTEYEIPIKGTSKQTLWAISWPARYLSKERNPKTGLGGEQVFLYEMSRFIIPPGTESKYKNTFEFFQWFAKNRAPQKTSTQ